MMLKVGLTGNIGSGKSMVSSIFRMLSIPVFDADLESKNILTTEKVKQQIRSFFGSEIFDSGEINRKMLAAVVFKDKERLKQLTNIIHPAVRNAFEIWMAQQKDSPYLIYEAAILIETGFHKQLDQIIMVSADKELRISRVMKRDNSTRTQVIQRMANQWEEERKIPYADYMIQNNEDDLLIPQVIDIHKRIIAG
ncbi:MAG: dephospho-CoA kinase [Bacteroidales bacterium]|nr:dephospho-CoA kinase [Bacteroidales bacterium]